jgi:putative transposase
MEKQTFDFEAFKKQAADRLRAGDTFFGKDGVLTPLLKEFVEEALDGELDAHLHEDAPPGPGGNRRNGRKTKMANTAVCVMYCEGLLRI